MRYAIALLLCLLIAPAFAVVAQTDVITDSNSVIATFAFTSSEQQWKFTVPAGSKMGRTLSFRSTAGDWEWCRVTGGPYNPVYANEQFNMVLLSDGDSLFLRGLGGAGSGSIRGWVSK